MVVPPCDERMLSKAAGSCIVRTGQVREGRADGTCSHHDIAYGLGEMLLQPSHDVELIGCVPFWLRTNSFNCVNQYVSMYRAKGIGKDNQQKQKQADIRRKILR